MDRERFVLTLDLGNRRAKVRRWEVDDGEAKLVGALDVAHGSCLPKVEAARWAAARAVVSSVAGEGVEARWDAWAEPLELRWERAGRPLELKVAVPESVGMDRQLAAAGALVGRDAAVVCDVGTAMTVDAAADGAFLGGAIAPGPELGARALHAHTARLPEVVPGPTTKALGGNTEEAILAGVVLGLRGAARELVAQAADEAGFADDVPVVVTGGARVLLLEPEPFTTRPVVEDADLVHRGLLAQALGT